LEQHEFECVVCNKSFKSEAQYEAHEKSKKHIKLVKQLRKDMKDQGRALDLDELPNQHEKTVEADDLVAHAEADTYEEGAHAAPEESGREAEATTNGHASSKLDSRSSTTDDEEDADYAPRDEVVDRLNHDKPDELAARLRASVLEDTPNTSGTEDSSQPKLGKAKLKRAKKAAQKASAGETAAKSSEAGFKCVVCQAGFPSKTRLFNHIKDQGHAAPVAQMKANSGKGKRK
jgi:DnaJ family protein A protein 5